MLKSLAPLWTSFNPETLNNKTPKPVFNSTMDRDSQTAQPQRPTPRSPFLALPLEVRLEIYSYLLHLPPYCPHQHHRPGAARVHPGLLLANRQVNAEATPLLYAHNTFVAHPTLLASFPRLRAWYHPVREAAVLARIRRFHVRLRLDCDVPYDRGAVAAAFSGLDELTIDLVQAVFMGVGCANLTRFDKVRGVARVTIRGSTTGFEDYVAWLQGAMTTTPGAAVADFVPSGPAWAYSDSLVH
ncbi:hypothetical protein HJFPF1_06715 [Paramyrothecium foliicola]|nr:hypothetical protein HJFPF1_06715 [Paramyrothecium foliicola]